MDFKDFTVGLMAQGHKATISIADFPEATVKAWLTYGTRRWFQDHMNAKAAILREEGKTVDGAALFEGRLAEAQAGEFGKRGPKAATKTEREAALLTVMQLNFRKVVGIALAFPKDCKKQGEKDAFLIAAYESLDGKRRAFIDKQVDEALDPVEFDDETEEAIANAV